MKNYLSKCLVSLVLAFAVTNLSLAAQYTPQEKANMQLVRDLYAALDAADAKGTTKEAIVGIAERYIAPNYIQHAGNGSNGRAAFVKMFQSMPASPPSASGSSQPPPAQLVALMAEGDVVVQITRRGSMMIWNLFRIENGKLAEHWDAGLPSREAGTSPPGGPPTRN